MAGLVCTMYYNIDTSDIHALTVGVKIKFTFRFHIFNTGFSSQASYRHGVMHSAWWSMQQNNSHTYSNKSTVINIIQSFWLNQHLLVTLIYPMKQTWHLILLSCVDWVQFTEWKWMLWWDRCDGNEVFHCGTPSPYIQKIGRKIKYSDLAVGVDATKSKSTNMSSHSEYEGTPFWQSVWAITGEF